MVFEGGLIDILYIILWAVPGLFMLWFIIYLASSVWEGFKPIIELITKD